ncbi:reverse transcriptase domain-containing protein [Dokdonella soli]|uniref:Reverse transcriptase domain-containing protein n=1 Tax=Dokdonella soli TaxID=529810 RepID=A0ABN1IXE8_9GAMM
MSTEILTPSIELLSQEYVLVQAWKKTSAYIRYHNWYADTLELDRSSVNLPQFLGGLSTEIRQSGRWQNTPLRMVPAPKSQDWHVSKVGMWEPRKRGEVESKLRPLAHADLRSQVVATAIMMCLADRVETAQGDPRTSHQGGFGERRVISYGNRLFCDATATGLRHRWGSSKLYRAYYQDYRSFIARPEVAAQAFADSDDSRVVIVHSDLKQFYDRVRPGLLSEKLAAVLQPGDDPAFHEFASHMLQWRWDERDAIEVSSYERIACVEDFSSIALPQGLVSAGFFANLVLLDFDEALRKSLLVEVSPGVRIVDAARYVDDLRIVLAVDRAVALDRVKELMCEWLQAKLDGTARGLKVSDEKTHAAELHGERRPLVRQSRKMARIQGAISGGFDAAGGVEILDAVQGLIRSQQRCSETRSEDSSWEFAPVPDVRDATVARFAAGRYRTTYRSLRPMLAERGDISLVVGELEPVQLERVSEARTQEDLDEEARAFALGLIEDWIDDPANVRLLRIGLDLWPTPEVLTGVLDLLKPFTVKGGRRKAPRRVAWYCLAEIFRAGATETGFVEDAECLPSRVDLIGYRKELGQEALRLSSLKGVGLPWYLRQQILLFLAVHSPTLAPIARAGSNSETKHYRELIRYLRGDSVAGSDSATLAVLARRSFSVQAEAQQLALRDIGPRRLEQIAERDPSFSLELIRAKPELAEAVAPRLRDDLCLQLRKSADGAPSLAELVLSQEKNGVLRNELALLSFSFEFLKNLKERSEVEVIAPVDVRVELQDDRASWPVRTVTIVDSRISSGRSFYAPPAWCPPDQRWRFCLGYLLRFVLTAREDFTRSVQETHWKEGAPTYRSGVNHWYQRLHGLFNGHAAFGDDWMPISEWVEQLMSALLRWPGSQATDASRFVEAGPEALMEHLRERITNVQRLQGPTTGLLMLRLAAPSPIPNGVARPLRACVIQTIIPGKEEDFNRDDLTCSDPKMRKRHRRHLSSALAAIERMLDLRETHKGRDGRLDWLILPELSVHPDDVRTHLIPFARAHRTIILAGLTYEELFRGQPYVNSALWIIPVWDSAHGLQMRVRRQGKRHLAPMEDSLNSSGTVIQGFRPCQWLVGYEWGSAGESREPLWLTAAICYDATDLALASDLRNRSDVFAIPALNRDVGTFDQMSLALHYHMFQMVIVANNGLYGGSNAYVPYKETYSRQVFHLHGQPQASIAFLEIEPIDLFQQRKTKVSIGSGGSSQTPQWKAPPAGLEK